MCQEPSIRDNYQHQQLQQLCYNFYSNLPQQELLPDPEAFEQKIIVLVLNKNRSKKRNLQIQLLISILHNYSRINHKNDFRDMRRFHQDSTPNTHDNTMCSIFCLESNTAASVTQPIKNLVKLRGGCQSLNFISLSLVVNSCEDCRNRYKLETRGAGDTGQIIWISYKTDH